MNLVFFDIECASVHKTTAKICAFGYVVCDEQFNIIKNLIDKADEIIQKGLMAGKSLYGLSIINKSILKTAVYEIVFEKTDIPVIINEYVEISKLFSDLSSAKFINAILDKISKQVERRCLQKA